MWKVESDRYKPRIIEFYLLNKMDKFLFDDFKGGKGVVNMGNKKKELDVKALIAQND